jgi:peptidyl-prolyl cis-trans isomerase B (cyclophilin B)
MFKLNNLSSMFKFSPAVLFALVLLTFGAGCVESGAVTPDGSVQGTLDDSSETSMKADTRTWTFQGQLEADKIEGKQVRITTDKGDIVFELLPDVAPITVSNFVYLTEGGYYDGLNFHRREEGFVIQGGDPLGNGTGGPGYSIPAEFNDVKHDRGMVAMARSMDPNSAGSQFYITLGPAYFLDNNYTVFGRVLEGMEVVDQIRVGDVMTKVVIEDKP